MPWLINDLKYFDHTGIAQAAASIPRSGPDQFRHPAAATFWPAFVLTGTFTGIGAAALTRLLELVQHLTWRGAGTNAVWGGSRTTPNYHP